MGNRTFSTFVGVVFDAGVEASSFLVHTVPVKKVNWLVLYLLMKCQNIS